MPFDLSLAVSDTLDDEHDFAIESDEEFQHWALNEADVSNRFTWYEMLTQALGDTVETGDALLVRSELDEPGRRYSTAYQLIEREQLDVTMDRPRGPGQNKIVNGIELDALDREVTFHLFVDDHPFDSYYSSGTGDSMAVPADRVIHVYRPSRSSAHVGISWFSSMVQSSRDRDWYLGNELTSAAIAALLTVLHKTDRPGGTLSLSDDGEDEDEYDNPYVKLGHGLMYKVPKDDDVSIVESTRPNSNAEPFIDLIDHDLAAGAELSYYRLTGRYNNTSYTAVRGAHLDDDAHVKPLQQWLGHRVLLPVRRRIQREAAARGYFRSITPRQYLRQIDRLQRFEVIGPGREFLDPETETEASIAKLRAGLSTLMWECAKRGLHWIRVLRQAALENRVAAGLGVVLDFSKGQGGQAEKTTRTTRTKSTREVA